MLIMQNPETFQLTLNFSLHLFSSFTKVPEWLSDLLRAGQGSLQVKHEVFQEGARVESVATDVGDPIASFMKLGLFFCSYHETILPFSIT